MVFVYARDCLMQQWWDKVTVILWGATVKLTGENENIQFRLEESQIAGVDFTVCLV